jgi:hypothetical protein
MHNRREQTGHAHDLVALVYKGRPFHYRITAMSDLSAQVGHDPVAKGSLPSGGRVLGVGSRGGRS